MTAGDETEEAKAVADQKSVNGSHQKRSETNGRAKTDHPKLSKKSGYTRTDNENGCEREATSTTAIRCNHDVTYIACGENPSLPATHWLVSERGRREPPALSA
jgi:hypothetical protein